MGDRLGKVLKDIRIPDYVLAQLQSRCSVIRAVMKRT